MRKRVKAQLLELVHTLEETNKVLKQLADQKESPLLINTLADEQEAAVAMGNQIEVSEGEGTPAVALLEKYCEILWQFSQAAGPKERREAWKQQTELLKQIRDEIERIPLHIIAVFLPYKASMWDSMESVWKAAEADPGCRAYVVPIPYFELKDRQVTAQHYEGDKYPDYVPVVDYRSVSLEELAPEMAFIHNPYDRSNLVTCLPPEYFSDQLKKYVEKLVYIPYFLTTNAVAPTHRRLPAYYFADHIVVQSEAMIDSFAGDIPREKFLPLGHPIADQVLYLEEHKPEIPSEWKPMLPNGKDFGGRRTIMLNTSISRMLKDRQRFLDKLEYLFRVAKQIPEVLLIWRPHPLLLSSARMADEKLAQRLQSMEERFLEEKIGVLDQTPDVGRAAALCDAYLGETESSVIHLFGVAGKPRFYIDNRIPEEIETEQICQISGRCRKENVEYLLLDEPGWIVTRERKEDGSTPDLKHMDEPGCTETGDDLHPLTFVPEREFVQGRAYSHMEIAEDKLYVYPAEAEGIFSYDLKSGQKKKRFPAGGFGQKDAVSRKMNAWQDFGRITISGDCLSVIRGEQFKKENYNHVWNESDKYTLTDFFRFMASAGQQELSGYRGGYQTWVANLDGSCGQKVYETVKEEVEGKT